VNATPESDSCPAEFIPTRWTLVLRARGESPSAQAALSELCEAYYAPVLAFIRGDGRADDAARELTQEFFARLLARHGLASVKPGLGRVRSFLLGAVKHFLADQRDRDQAVKRGGGQTIVSVEADLQANTTSQLQVPDPATQPRDTIFDREWAETLVRRAIDALANESVATGKADLFEALKPWLLGQVDGLSQADAACQLGMTEGAVKVAIHRLRKRFRELVKTEIAHTVPEPAQVQEELRYLVEVLASGPVTE
jgi:DNA-directed RNA polymerase specialized sigma24 family protein